MSDKIEEEHVLPCGCVLFAREVDGILQVTTNFETWTSCPLCNKKSVEALFGREFSITTRNQKHQILTAF